MHSIRLLLLLLLFSRLLEPLRISLASLITQLHPTFAPHLKGLLFSSKAALNPKRDEARNVILPRYYTVPNREDVSRRSISHEGQWKRLGNIFKFKIKTRRDPPGMAEPLQRRGKGEHGGKRILSSRRAILSRETIFYPRWTGGKERGANDGEIAPATR